MDAIVNHPTEALTDAGYAWAWANVSTSMPARVALFGARAWPAAHVDTAIRTCNESGAAAASAA